MNENQQVAYIISQVACAMIEMEGMKAENLNRENIGQSPAYAESDFAKLLNKYCIGHNDVIGFFRGGYYG